MFAGAGAAIHARIRNARVSMNHALAVISMVPAWAFAICTRYWKRDDLALPTVETRTRLTWTGWRWTGWRRRSWGRGSATSGGWLASGSHNVARRTGVSNIALTDSLVEQVSALATNMAALNRLALVFALFILAVRAVRVSLTRAGVAICAAIPLRGADTLVHAGR